MYPPPSIYILRSQLDSNAVANLQSFTKSESVFTYVHVYEYTAQYISAYHNSFILEIQSITVNP